MALGIFLKWKAKQYPREHSRDHLHSGRVRVQLVNSEGKPFVSEYKTRKDVLFLVCEQIPKLKSRHSRGSEATGDSQGQSGASSKKKRKHK
uniref:Uncharacterized protein n=1 Tax=Amphimedon queenslandica TaxID=400682 RepID=A0A1X7VK78_AMPQE